MSLWKTLSIWMFLFNPHNPYFPKTWAGRALGPKPHLPQKCLSPFLRTSWGQQGCRAGGTPASPLELSLRILAGQKVDQMPGGALGRLAVGLSQSPGASLSPGGEFGEQSTFSGWCGISFPQLSKTGLLTHWFGVTQIVYIDKDPIKNSCSGTHIP